MSRTFVRCMACGSPQHTLGILFQDLFYGSGLFQVNINSSLCKNLEGIHPASAGDKSVY